MGKWPAQIGALELLREKNRLGRGSDLGTWGDICTSGAPNDFSRSYGIPRLPTHYSQEPKIVEAKCIGTGNKRLVEVGFLVVAQTQMPFADTHGGVPCCFRSEATVIRLVSMRAGE